MEQSKIRIVHQANSVIEALSHQPATVAHQAVFDKAKAAAQAVIASSTSVTSARVADAEARARLVACDEVLHGCFRSLCTLMGVAFRSPREPFKHVGGPRPGVIASATPARRVLLLDQLLPGLAAAATTPMLKQSVADVEVALAASHAAQETAADRRKQLVHARERRATAIAVWASAYEQLGLAARLEWPDSPALVAGLLATDRGRGTGGGRRRVTPVVPAPPVQPAPAPAPPP